MSPPAAPTLAQQAEAAAEIVQGEPRRAARLAETTRQSARAARDREAEAAAEWALGLAARELNDVEAAVRHLRTAARIARAAGLPAKVARARVSLALALAEGGDLRAALREVDDVIESLRGHDAAVAQMQRALLLQRAGRLEEALEGYRRALPVLRRHGDGLREARLLTNRGVARGYRGELSAAEGDFVRAEGLYNELGLELAAADVHWNLGFVATRRGDVPAALACFDQAERYFDSHEVPRPELLLDRCELLLAVRLVGEARAVAERAVVELSRRKMATDLAEARLMLAQAALLDGDHDAAGSAAELAGRTFRRQRQASWLVLARYTALRSAWRASPPTPAMLRRALGIADALSTAGMRLPALDARLLCARIALDLGRVPVARRELGLARRARRRGTVDIRSRAWHAEALLRLADGDRRGADRALRAGLRALDEHRLTLGATELRIHVSQHGADLAMLGLRLALEQRSPERVLAWSERWRASALRVRPVRPPDDPTLAAATAELRRVAFEVEQALLDGRDATRLARRQRELEADICRLARQVPGAGQAEPVAQARAVAGALDGRVLVELVEAGDELHAVVVRAGRALLRHIGPAADVRRELGWLRFGLRNLARRSSKGVDDTLAQSAARLDELLLGPVRDDLGDSSLVVVPTGELHALPWALLPSCRGRPVTVAPSASLWLKATRMAAPPACKVALVAGPRLEGAAAEVAALAAGYEHAVTLSAGAASVAAVAAALDGAQVAHVAAHGTFRQDNPLFSALELSDGRLTAYELEALDRSPHQLVLSACNLGLSEVHPGDELMGFASVLLALDTCTVIASSVPVPDEPAAPLMLDLHARLRAGTPPATALAEAQAAADPAADPGRFAAAAGFVCLGAG